MAGATVKFWTSRTRSLPKPSNLIPRPPIPERRNPGHGGELTFQIVDPAKGLAITSYREHVEMPLESEQDHAGIGTATRLEQVPIWDQEVLARGLNYGVHAYGSTESTYRRGLSRVPKSTALLKGRRPAGRFLRRDSQTRLANSPKSGGDAEAQYYLGLAYAGFGRNSQAAAMWSGIPLSSGLWCSGNLHWLP